MVQYSWQAIQVMCFNIHFASLVPWDSSLQKNQVLKKDIYNSLFDNKSKDCKESYTRLKTACHWHFVSRKSKIKNQCELNQDSKFVPQHNYSQKDDYMSKIFMGYLPTSVNPEYLTQLVIAELGCVKKAVLSLQSQGFGFLELEREEGVVIANDHMVGKRLDVGNVDMLYAKLQSTTSLSSLKDVIELAVGGHGYQELRTLVHFILSIRRMSAPAGNGGTTDHVALILLLQPKCIPLLEPFSFRFIELQSCQQFPRSSRTSHITVASAQDAQDIERHHLAACRSNTEKQMIDASRTRSKKVPVFVRHCSGEVVLTVNLDEPAAHMMQLFEELTKMKLEYHYFHYGKKRINPKGTLLSYGVGCNARVEAYSRLRGGKYPTLEEYIHQNESVLIMEVTLRDGNISLEMTEKGCRILSTWLSCFMWAFSRSKSWGGNFTLKDFYVRDDHVRIGVKSPKGNYGLGAKRKDIEQLLMHVEKLFCRNKSMLVSEYPPFLRNLTKYLKELAMVEFDTISESHKLFIETHISCTTSARWGMLLLKLHKRYLGLNEAEKEKWYIAINSAQCPYQWHSRLPEKMVFKDMFERARKDARSYPNTHIGAFTLMRDTVMHALDREDNNRSDQQIYQNADKLGLMIPVHMLDFFPHVIENFIKKNIDISAELYSAKVSCFCSRCALSS